MKTNNNTLLQIIKSNSNHNVEYYNKKYKELVNRITKYSEIDKTM